MFDEVQQGRFKNATGSAISFTAIEGVGEKTARAIKNSTRANVPSDVADYSSSTLAQEAGISENRASKVIREGGGNPNVDERGRSGSVSAAGMAIPHGDFLPDATEHSKADIVIQPERSEAAKRVDNRRRAPITTDLETWKQNPGKYDYPGIDTPTNRPKAKPKDYKSGAEIKTTDPDEEREIASGRNTNSLPTTERNTDAPEPFTSELAQQDLSLAPEEAFEGVGSGSAQISQTKQPSGLAGGEKADMLFVESEQRRPDVFDDFSP